MAETTLKKGALVMLLLFGVMLFGILFYITMKEDALREKTRGSVQAPPAQTFTPKFWVDEIPKVGKMWAVTQPAYASETTMLYVIAKDENGNKFLVWLSNTSWHNPTRIGPPILPGQELRVRHIRYAGSLAFINPGILIVE